MSKGRYVYYQPNSKDLKDKFGDCQIRALSKAMNCSWNKFVKWRINRNRDWDLKDIFPEWHNQRYFIQCYYNLQEKYDCGGITEKEWKIIEGVIKK